MLTSDSPMGVIESLTPLAGYAFVAGCSEYRGVGGQDHYSHPSYMLRYTQT